MTCARRLSHARSVGWFIEHLPAALGKVMNYAALEALATIATVGTVERLARISVCAHFRVRWIGAEITKPDNPTPKDPQRGFEVLPSKEKLNEPPVEETCRPLVHQGNNPAYRPCATGEFLHAEPPPSHPAPPRGTRLLPKLRLRSPRNGGKRRPAPRPLSGMRNGDARA